MSTPKLSGTGSGRQEKNVTQEPSINARLESFPELSPDSFYSIVTLCPLINAHIGKKNLFPKEKRKQVLFVLDGSFRCGKVGRKF